jgi:hypothetical protein
MQAMPRFDSNNAAVKPFKLPPTIRTDVFFTI